MEDDLGDLFIDSTRISSVEFNFSAVPDIVLLCNESIDSGKVRLVPKATQAPDRFVEVTGAPDLVVEIVSDSSVIKDTKRRPIAYFATGVREFWLVDVRGEETKFAIFRRGALGFEAVQVNKNGFQCSDVLGRQYQLIRERNKHGRLRFTLNEEPLESSK